MPALREAQALAMAADVVLIVGSSLQVYPAAGIPRLARQHGAELCIVNAEPTPFDEVASAVIHGKAGGGLPQNVGRMAAGQGGSPTRDGWPQAGQTKRGVFFGAPE